MTRKELGFRAAGIVGSWILRALGATLRFEAVEEERWAALHRKGEPFIFVIWHAWMLPLIYRHRNQGVAILASDHGDGEYIARIVERTGFSTSARGSSTRGGEKGLRALVRSLRGGMPGAITPDGPRGPARKIKEGALIAAQLSGVPIVAIASSASSSWRLSSWDRFVIPKPFSRVRIVYGGPWWIPRSSTEEELRGISDEIEAFLNHTEEGG